MSTPIIPFAVWQSGTNQNSIPANDNSLRNQILNGLVIGTANDEAGGDADGDIYIVGSSPAGAFASFDEGDLAIFMGGNWYAFAPVEGIVVNLAGAAKYWDGSGYADWGGGGGIASVVAGAGISVDATDPANPIVSATGGGGSDEVTIVSESSAFTIATATHSGRSRLILAGGNITFNVAESYSAGNVFNIVATSALDLLTSGVTLTPPAGGTLELEADMAVSVVMTSSSAGRIIGQTVPA